MKELVEYMQKEWAAIGSAPFTFAVAFVIIGGLCYAVSKWHHSGIIDTLRERISLKEERIEHYREQILQVPAQSGEIGKESPAAIRDEALKFVASLREWLTNRRMEESARQNRQWLEMTGARNGEERKRDLWMEHSAEMLAASTKFNSEYDTKFKIRAIVLRDELMTRVAHPNPPSHDRMLYEHPTNPIGMGEVADDLERMALMLK